MDLESLLGDLDQALGAEWEESAELEEELASLLGQLSKYCLDEATVPVVVARGSLVSQIVAVAGSRAPRDVANRALICLGNLALFPQLFARLDEGERDRCVDMAMRVLGEMLNKAEVSDEELDCGLSCAFLLCRTVGNHETGPGVDMLEQTPLVREKLLWILTAVLDAGEGGTVLGFSWEPANILHDVATLSNSDRLKPLLGEFIPAIVRALRERGWGNFRLVKFASQALSQLLFAPQCFAYFYPVRGEIKRLLRGLINNAKFKQDEPEFAPVKNEIEGLLGSLDALNVPADELQDEEQPAGSGKHVFVSYQWDNIKLASELQTRLVERGVGTWMDILDMGPNFNESMDFAIDNALAMVCITSQGYQDSLSCRKECELAEAAGVKLVWVTGEENKLGEEALRRGWLGNALAGEEPISTVHRGMGWALEEILAQVEGAEEEDGEEQEEEEHEHTLPLPEHADDMFKLLIDMMGALKRENIQLKTQMKALESINALILADMDGLKTRLDQLQPGDQEDED